MKRQLLLASGCSMLLAGWFSAFLLNTVPQYSSLYIIGPTLLLGIGMAVIRKTAGVKLTVVTMGLTALAALLAMNQLNPDKALNLSAIQRDNDVPALTGELTSIMIREADRVDPFAVPRWMETFADVDIQLFARLPGPPRMMAFDSRGHLYVTIPKLGAIYQLTDADNDGYSEQPVLFHVGMDYPHGLIWSDDKLYVAETSQVLELRDTNQDDQADNIRIVVDDLPDDGGHLTRSLAMGQDGFLYLSIGSRCNACEEINPWRATILKVNPETGRTSIFARGLRNTVGLSFSADGETLWGSDNGRDRLGDEIPPDEINQIVESGDYGWPFCFGQQLIDPELGSFERCQQTVASQVDLPAHSAPLGITFGDRLDAPEEYKNSLYVALHGSWDATEPKGYELIRIPYDQHLLQKHGEKFLSGWLSQGKVWGRPVDPVVGPDGNLYLSDDRANAIYRISWKH
ncbi:Glucose/arabinose dehydrogenase, beta-propeller fold [Desulfuromusa kysingii]|uniref:Glucose/arabinose dehydrogenase, beta-propeller fold n=1 Tax=Desulfuromusa kysingii TaxID=37625 RepID=A0A1H4DPK8_9BACT|nr:PQQ-dependent sugar dehydrogenase [Desulfuromusa kysingii]SEA74448.1 Glucose/arabinose dehydrogenase, beta-propeller fold [Desulfuromusa kysingii]